MNPNTKTSLEKMYEAACNNKLGAMTAEGSMCVYKQGEKNCAIGAALPENIMGIVQAKGLNTGHSYRSLCSEIIGLEDILGLTVDQGQTLQRYHDAAYAPEASSMLINITPDNFRHMLYLIKEGLVTQLRNGSGDPINF